MLCHALLFSNWSKNCWCLFPFEFPFLIILSNFAMLQIYAYPRLYEVRISLQFTFLFIYLLTLWTRQITLFIVAKFVVNNLVLFFDNLLPQRFQKRITITKCYKAITFNFFLFLMFFNLFYFNFVSYILILFFFWSLTPLNKP